MIKPYGLIVFDWEGTLSDTLGQVMQAFAAEAKRLDLGELDMAVGRRAMALGPVVAIKKLFPHLPTHQQSDLLEAAQRALISNALPICLMPGTHELLLKIKKAGMQLAIATNRGQQSLMRDLEAADLADWFDVTRSASQCSPKPSPQMLNEIREACGVSSDETVMVGDSVSDIEMAVHGHVMAIGVDFYHQNETILREAGAVEVIDDFSQLTRILGLS